MAKKTTEEFKNEVFLKYGNEFTVLGEYVGNKEKILVKHNICGNEYLVIPVVFLKKKSSLIFNAFAMAINTCDDGVFWFFSYWDMACFVTILLALVTKASCDRPALILALLILSPNIISPFLYM